MSRDAIFWTVLLLLAAVVAMVFVFDAGRVYGVIEYRANHQVSK